SFIPTTPYTEDLFGLPVINIRNVPLSNTYNRIIKRIVDLFGAIVALALFSIPMLLVAFIISLTSNGPIIYSQVRIGKHNKEFKMYKFRSMEIQAEKDEKKAWTTHNDPRVTGIGKFIRRTSIDEFPQFFNVLKGEMSLVGPRPERPFFVEKFKEEIPRYMIKHQVSPGLTGWAQINGYRGDTSIRKRIDHDLFYIENWTLGLDFKIIFLTVFKGFINKNAY
ncbi:MAG: exopolysaccharide biosynthesis polyprenyl glycosylphosphotransferase, partial [Mobilitalea sp.]